MVIRWVLDATALVDLLVGTDPGYSLGLAFRADLCAAPETIDADAAALLSRLVDAGLLPEPEAAQVLEAVLRAPLVRCRTTSLLPRAWAARDRAGVRAATGLERAARLGVPLFTSDPRLAGPAAELERSLLLRRQGGGPARPPPGPAPRWRRSRGAAGGRPACARAPR